MILSNRKFNPETPEGVDIQFNVVTTINNLLLQLVKTFSRHLPLFFIYVLIQNRRHFSPWRTSGYEISDISGNWNAAIMNLSLKIPACEVCLSFIAQKLFDSLLEVRDQTSRIQGSVTSRSMNNHRTNWAEAVSWLTWAIKLVPLNEVIRHRFQHDISLRWVPKIDHNRCRAFKPSMFFLSLSWKPRWGSSLLLRCLTAANGTVRSCWTRSTDAGCTRSLSVFSGCFCCFNCFSRAWRFLKLYLGTVLP